MENEPKEIIEKIYKNEFPNIKSFISSQSESAELDQKVKSIKDWLELQNHLIQALTIATLKLQEFERTL